MTESSFLKKDLPSFRDGYTKKGKIIEIQSFCFLFCNSRISLYIILPVSYSERGVTFLSNFGIVLLRPETKNQSIMKHIIITSLVFIFVVSFEAKAQGLVYTPFIPQQSSSSTNSDSWFGNSSSSPSRMGYSRPSAQTQTIQTTAYYADYNGDYYKVPIRVEYTIYSNGASSLCVTEKWQSNGFKGQWYRLPSRASVQYCQPITANGNTAELERAFMYKAMVGTNWFYFDL